MPANSAVTPDFVTLYGASRWMSGPHVPRGRGPLFGSLDVDSLELGIQHTDILLKYFACMLCKYRFCLCWLINRFWVCCCKRSISERWRKNSLYTVCASTAACFTSTFTARQHHITRHYYKSQNDAENQSCFIKFYHHKYLPFIHGIAKIPRPLSERFGCALQHDNLYIIWS